MALPPPDGGSSTTTSTSSTTTRTSARTSSTAPTSFVTSLLKTLGYPTTSANISFLNAWMRREGGGGANNPLNTTQRMPGSTSFNSVGVQNYADMATGVQATVKTLRNGRYGDLLNALASGTPSTNTTYKGLSTWSGNGYSSLSGVSATTYQPMTSGAAMASSSMPTAGAKDITAQVEKSYGYLAAYLKDPELGPILIKAAQNGWDQDTLQGALYKTKWWKTHSDSARSFDAQAKLDPATTKAQIAAQLANLQTEARNFGLIVDPKRLSQMAINSLRGGWNGQQIRNALVSEGKFDMTGKNGSAALTLRDNLLAKASQYLVPIDAKTMRTWAQNVTRGDVSESDFDGYLKEQAKSLFPSMANAIDAGVTVAQYVQPYKNIAAQTLEIDPESVQFTNPKWSKALFQVDKKTGARTAMSLADWQNTLRTDPTYGWDKTQQAHQQAADLATKISSTFGAG